MYSRVCVHLLVIKILYLSLKPVNFVVFILFYIIIFLKHWRSNQRTAIFLNTGAEKRIVE